jgi:hypothetical protein
MQKSCDIWVLLIIECRDFTAVQVTQMLNLILLAAIYDAYVVHFSENGILT